MPENGYPLVRSSRRHEEGFMAKKTQQNPHKTELYDVLIQKCIDNQEPKLDLGMCGLTDWPDEVCEMHWLEELNFCNYYLDEPEPGDYSNFGQSEWREYNRHFRVQGRVLVRNHIKTLPSKSQLRKMKALTKLSLGGGVNPYIGKEYWGLDNITGLEVLPELAELCLHYTRLARIHGLSALSGLSSLSLGSTGVSDLSALSGLTGLSSLNLEDTGVSDLSALSGLTGLSSLSLGSTGVSDLSALSGLTGLSSLNLALTGVSDLSALSGLTGLSSLDLGDTGVSDLSALSGLTGLSSLDLRYTGVSDLSALSGLTGLSSLDLRYTGVSDLSALSGLTGLTSLNLWSTEVSDLGPLKELLGKPHMRVVWENDYGGGVVLEDTQIPMENVKLGIEALLTDIDAQENLGAKYILNQEAKLVLLGNSTAGKTSLLTYLKTEAQDRVNIDYSALFTTHGIKNEEWKPSTLSIAKEKKLDDLTIRILDFGGQEYYHDCHHLFFTHNTAYIVLWEKATNRNAVIDTPQTYEDKEDQTEPIAHFELAYWLDAIRYFAPQKKMGKDVLVAMKTEISDLLAKEDVPNLRFKERRPRFTSEALAEILVIKIEQKGMSRQTIREVLKGNFDDSAGLERLENVLWEKEKSHVYDGLAALVVQNKIGDENQEAFLNQEHLAEEFPFVMDFTKVDVRGNIAMEHFVEYHINGLLNQLPIVGDVMLDFYPEVDKVLDEQGELYLSRKQFDKLFVQVVEPKIVDDLTPQEKKEKLAQWGENYLDHRLHTGKLLWFPESKNKTLAQTIFIRPYDMINRFYAILNRELEQESGRFTDTEAQQKLRVAHFKYSKKVTPTIKNETKLMLDLMIHFNIVFFMNVAEKSFYVAPQYLPEAPHKSKHFLDPVFTKGTHRYAYQGFFHKTVVFAFFSRYGAEAASTHDEPLHENDFMLWRDGLLVKRDDQMVMVEFNPKEYQTLLKPQDGDPNGTLISEMKEHFNEIHEGRQVSLEVSVDGEHFVELEQLIIKAKAEIPFLDIKGKVHRVADYSNFFPKELKEKFMRKKLFISYSSKDRALIEEFKSHLSPLRRNGEVETWDDHEIGVGDKWDAEIEKQMRTADIILLMISSDFINTDYVWHKEIPIAFDQEKAGKAKVVPIILRHCDWTSLNHQITDNNAVDKGIPITSHADRDKAWTIVAKALKLAVRGKNVNG